MAIPPVLDAPPASTSSNPYAVTGTASPGDLVWIYVNGVQTASVTANATTGAFSIPIALNDGAQSVHAIAVSGSQSSAPSNTISVNYVNNTARTYTSATISANTVWTAGAAPGATGPYVINSNLTIAAGATLTIQPGALVQFDTSTTPGIDQITVNGTLRIQGTATSKVTLQRVSGTVRHYGITVNSTGVAMIDNAVIEHTNHGITVAGGIVTVANTLIRDFVGVGITIYSSGRLTITENVEIDGSANATTTGISLNPAGPSSINGLSVHHTRYGISMASSSPTITGSTIQQSSYYGIYVPYGCSPVITGNTVTANATGIFVTGYLPGYANPAPVINGNDIYANTTWDLKVGTFVNPLSSTLNARDNWWGSTSPEQIAAKIEDQTENTYSATADWRGFRASSAVAGGGPVNGSFLLGPMTGTIDAIQPHTVIGDLIVAPSTTLTIEPGAQLRFVPGARLFVQGTLLAVGNSGGIVHLRSSKATPAAGDWDGIYIDTASTGSRIEFALIEHAWRGVEVRSASAQILDSTIRTYGRSSGAISTGVYLYDSSSLLLRNTIDDAGVTSINPIGVMVEWVNNSTKSPTLDRNTIRNNYLGVDALASTAGSRVSFSMLGNTIEQSSYGLRLRGGIGAQDGTASASITENFIRNNASLGIEISYPGGTNNPLPLINGNDIHGNGSKDLYLGAYYANPSTVVIDATRNWWGTTSLAAIRSKITDHAVTATTAIVNFGSPLDASIAVPGNPTPGNFLAGPQPSGTALASGTTYEVLSVLSVPTGTTLAVQSGAVLRFQAGAKVVVSGTLDAQGGTFTSGAATPTTGSWGGVRISAGSSGTFLNGVTIEWATDSLVVDGASATVQGCTIRKFSTSGVTFLASASGSVSGTIIENVTRAGKGIVLSSSSPTISASTVRSTYTGIELTSSNASITGNTIENNDTGINVLSGSSPSITSGNVIRTNTYSGISLSGVPSNAALDPKPVIHGNQIYSNQGTGSSFNLAISQVYGNPATVIDAEGNYWGSTTPSQIATWIRDKSENVSYATVDFDPFLDANGQPIGGGNTLGGSLTANTTLTTGSSWSMISNTTVPGGITLTVEAGVDVSVAPGARLTVNGAIVVSGTAASRAVFRSSQATPTSGAWDGIWIASGGSASIAYADIRHGYRAVSAVGASGTVSVTDTLFSDFGRPGSAGAAIWVESSLVALERNTLTHSITPTAGYRGIHLQQALAGSVVAENSIQGIGTGIYLQQSSPTISGNTISSNDYGIEIRYGSSPVIQGGNVISGNDTGVLIQGNNSAASDPAPVIQDNDIFSNAQGSTVRNVMAVSFGNSAVQVNAHNNWWGSADPATIAAGIYDRTDVSNLNAPYVSIVPFLDASVIAGGTPVSGNFLAGALTTPTTLTAGATYDVVGSYLVASGGSLTIPAGTTLRFVDGAEINTKGALSIQGTATSPVVLTSRSASPTRGIWKGIVIDAGSGSVVDHAQILWATNAVWVNGVSATVSNSQIGSFSGIGIYMTSGGGTLSGNTIDNGNDTGTGIHLVDSSPAITGNTISNAQVGIYLFGASSPTINGHNVISSNRIGVQLNAGAAARPNPGVNDNDLFDNVWAPGDVRNLQISGYYGTADPAASVKLDFQRNWWGSTSPQTILAGIEDLSMQPAAVDVSNFLTSAGGSPSSTPAFSIPLSNVRRSVNAFSPGLGGTASILFDLYNDATVTLTLFDEDDGTIATPVRTISVPMLAGNDRVLTWDGRDNAGALVNEDAYGYALTATDNVGTSVWNPSRPPMTLAEGLMLVQSGLDVFNTFENDFWKRTATVTGYSVRFDLTVTPVGSSTGFTLYPKKILPVGTHTLFWDGRDPSGQIVSVPVTLKAAVPYTRVLLNSVVVENVDPNISGPAPSVEVVSNPWLMVHSYGQLAHLTYHLDQSAQVTVKLLPPGVADPASPSAITMLGSTAQSPGDYTVEWSGTTAGDVNAIRLAEEGAFTFTIQAVNQATGRSTLYRGVLQLRQ